MEDKYKKAYNKCIKFRYKKIKKIPYQELDLCLFLVEKYFEIQNIIEEE